MFGLCRLLSLLLSFILYPSSFILLFLIYVVFVYTHLFCLILIFWYFDIFPALSHIAIYFSELKKVLCSLCCHSLFLSLSLSLSLYSLGFYLYFHSLFSFCCFNLIVLPAKLPKVEESASDGSSMGDITSCCPCCPSIDPCQAVKCRVQTVQNALRDLRDRHNRAFEIVGGFFSSFLFFLWGYLLETVLRNWWSVGGETFSVVVSKLTCCTSDRGLIPGPSMNSNCSASFKSSADLCYKKRSHHPMYWESHCQSHKRS